MKKVILTILAAMAIGVMGCKKEQEELPSYAYVYTYYTENTAQAVFGTRGIADKAPNVTVTLYKTKTDLEQEKNKVVSGVTDANGNLQFENLEDGIYYVVASKEGCFYNATDIEKEKNIVTYIKNKEMNIYVHIDKISPIDINNYWDKDVYVSIDDETDKVLVEKSKSKRGYLTPHRWATPTDYLEHTLKLYNNSFDTAPFREMRITANDNCSVLPVDLNTNKRNLIFVFEDEQRKLLGEGDVAVQFNGETKFTNNVGEISFEITDTMNSEIPYIAYSYCQTKNSSINPYQYKDSNNYVSIQIRRPKGKIKLNNTSTSPYTVTIGSEQYVVEGGATKTIETSLGSKNINVRQKSGYILYPTVNDYTGTVTCDEILTVTFP